MTDTVANFIIRGDTSNAVQSLNAVKNATDNMKGSADKGKEAFKGLIDSISPIGFTAAAAGAAIGLFVKNSVEAAGTLQLIQTKAMSVYGTAFPAMQKASQVMAASMHRDSSDILDGFTTMSMILEGRGLTQGIDAMSEDLTKLSVNMQKAFGGTQEDALRAIEMGLMGTGRALREYTIRLDDNALQQYAASQGIRDKVTEMNSAQKAYITENYLLQQSASISDIANKATGGWNDSVTALHSSWHDLEETFGTTLLPTITDEVKALTDQINSLIKSMGEAVPHASMFQFKYEQEYAQKNGGTLRQDENGQFVTDYTSPNFKGGALSQQIGDNTKATTALGDATKKTGEEIKKAYGAISSDGMKGATGSANKLADELKALGSTYESVSQEITDKLTSLDQDHATKMASIRDQIAQTITSIQALKRTWQEGLQTSQDSEADSVVGELQKIKDLSDSLKQVSNMQGIASLLDQRKDTTGEYANKLSDKDARSLGITKDADKKTADDILTLNAGKTSLSKYLQNNADVPKDVRLGLNGLGTMSGSTSFMDLLTKGVAAVPGSKGATARAGEDDFTKEIEKIQKAQDANNKQYYEQKANNDKTIADQTKKQSVEEQTYASARAQMLLTKTALESFAGSYATSMGNMDNVTKSTVDSMKAKLDDLKKSIASIDILLKSNPEATGGQTLEQRAAAAGVNRLANVPGRASGGPAGGLTWVGERGPELVNLPSGSYVHSNEKSKQMTGGISIGAIHVHNEADEDRLIAKLTRLMQLRQLAA